MTEPVALVRCTGAGRTFGSGPASVVALYRASCVVFPGDRIALSGPSGSGKSTLLHLMAGLDAPTAGEVRWAALGDRTVPRPAQIAIVFQGPSLLPPLDVLENVGLPLLLAHADPVAARLAAMRALERLGLDELAAKLPEELSGGQAQRVAVARALASSPRLILADEPTGQLDHSAGAAVVDALVETAASTGAALVVSTHDPDVAARFERRWSVADGRLCTDDARQEEPCAT